MALLDAHERQGVLERPLGPAALGTAQRESMVERLAPALAGRYCLEGVLGEGGMATVFRARESKHDRPVVLKVLRPDAAAWLGPERFQSEIQIVARLSHPHIVALIDSGEADGLFYYVMPFVEGETLRSRLREGPLPVDETRTLLRDLADALAHAHRHGIVHRDLKPENVLWVAGHAFLMDFGVAKLRPEPGAISRTADGLAIGTPAYMAPEQANGQPVDARSDVYGWGLLAAEALLGRLTRSSARLVRRPDLPPALVALIEETLAEDPSARPANGQVLLDRLNAIPSDAPPQRVRRGPVRRWWPLGAAVLAGLVALVLVRPSGGVPSLESVPGPLVVSPLRNETGDSSLAMWGRLAGDYLTQGLQQTGRARVVPWPVALQAADRLLQADGAGVSAVDLMRAETGAGTVVTGAYYLVGADVRFQVELIDARTGALLGAIPAVEARRDSMQQGIQHLRARLMGALAVRTDEYLAGMPGVADRPPTYEAYRLFERGITLYNQLDYRPAAAALIDAWRADTTFLQPLVYASRALWNTGARGRVDSLMRSLRGRQALLNPHLDLEVQYLEALLAGDAPRALAAIRRAAEVAPGSRSAYNLAFTALTVNQPAEALAALRTLDPDRGPMRNWAPYWYTLSHALHLLGRFDDELGAAREARRRFPDSRAAWVHEARALAALGRTREIDSLLEQAATLPPDTYWSQGAAMVIAGEELVAHGRPERAPGYFERAESWFANQLARDPNHRGHRYWLGSAYYDQRRWRDAEPYFESLARDAPDDPSFRTGFAVLAAHRGDTALAGRRLGLPPAYDRGSHTAARARVAAIGGNLEAAVSLWSQALGQGVGGLVWLHASARPDLLPMASDPRFQRLGLLSPPGAVPAPAGSTR